VGKVAKVGIGGVSQSAIWPVKWVFVAVIPLLKPDSSKLNFLKLRILSSKQKNSEIPANGKFVEKFYPEFFENETDSDSGFDSNSDSVASLESVNFYNTVSDLKVDLDSDKMDCPSCHFLEVGREKLMFPSSWGHLRFCV
jgi:hypothetical protein